MTVLVSLWKPHLLTSYCKKIDFSSTFLTLWEGWCKRNFSADNWISMKLGIVWELYRPYMTVLVSLCQLRWKLIGKKPNFYHALSSYTLAFFRRNCTNKIETHVLCCSRPTLLFKKKLLNLVARLMRKSPTKTTPDLSGMSACVQCLLYLFFPKGSHIESSFSAKT